VSITVQKLADKLHNTDPAQSATVALLDLLLDAISPMQRQAYFFILDNPGATSMAVAEHLDVKQNRAGNLLNSLKRLGLIVGTTITNEGAIHYSWRVWPQGGKIEQANR